MRIGARDGAAEAFDRRLIARASIALRTAELHERGNAVSIEAAEELYATLSERLETLGATSIACRSSHLFVDGERVRLGASEYLHLRYLLQLFDQWDIGSITLLPGLTRAELTGLVYALARYRRTGPADLATRLAQERVVHVDLGPPPEEEAGDEADDLAMRTYGACLDVMEDLRSSITANHQIRTRRLRRITQSVVDQMLSDEYALLALSTIKQFDDHLFTHSTNVAILSVSLGQRLGLSKTQLGELCLAAFLHDLGKIAVPRDILDKPGALDDYERSEMNQHPIHSVHILLNQGHLGQSTLRAIIGGFEHHLNYDLTGYPHLTQKDRISLFGRVITLTDRYDALTTPRSYRAFNRTPHEGVCHLIERSGVEFDPVLVKLFVGLVGLYPPGTAVELDDGTRGVVAEPPAPDTPVDRPRVRRLGAPADAPLIDLAERGEQGGYLRRIAAVYNPGNGGQLPAFDQAALNAL